MNYGLILPFLDQDPKYCYGVELGMLLAKMLRRRRVIKGYYRTENEEQIRLAATLLNYEVKDLRSWTEGPPDNGWVYIRLEAR